MRKTQVVELKVILDGIDRALQTVREIVQEDLAVRPRTKRGITIEGQHYEGPPSSPKDSIPVRNPATAYPAYPDEGANRKQTASEVSTLKAQADAKLK